MIYTNLKYYLSTRIPRKMKKKFKKSMIKMLSGFESNERFEARKAHAQEHCKLILESKIK